MKSIVIDKIIIFLLCFFTVFETKETINFLVAALLAVSLSCVISFWENNRITFFIFLLFIILSFFNIYFVYFLPLLLYDTMQLSNKHHALILIIPAIYSSLLYADKMLYRPLAFLVLCCLISLLLAYKTYSNSQLLKDYKALRDTITEANINLDKKNKILMEKQDYEIHLATLHERTRIAREIHDNVGHMLSRSLLQVGALLAITKDELVVQNLEALKNTLNEAMNNIRNSVHDLKDDALDLDANVRTLLSDFKDYTINYEYDAGNHLPKNIKYCILTIIKEALANVVKHSNADTISIIIRQHPSFCQLLIEDNGSNISLNSSGIGLENMRERVEAFNGNFKVSINNGFKIFISIPLDTNMID